MFSTLEEDLPFGWKYVLGEVGHLVQQIRLSVLPMLDWVLHETSCKRMGRRLYE